MPKSRKEIQREYRRRRDADFERRLSYLQKERTKYRQDLASGKRKLVIDMHEREARKQRREWKKRQRQSRKAQQDRVRTDTPPPTPSEAGGHQSRQKERGRKHVRRERAAAYRRIAELEEELAKARRKAERYKKRYQRTHQQRTPSQLDTPRTKTRKLLANFHSHKRAVRKTLVFHYALVNQIKSRYQDTRLERHRRTFAGIVTGRIIRQYRLQRMSAEQFGFYSRKRSETTREMFDPPRKRRCFAKRCLLQEVTTEFFMRDDVSRATAGKKETVTRCKNKMQKRLLLDTLTNTHVKFCSEFLEHKISYSLFCRLKPFWVVPPTVSDRETCLCRVHDNLQFMVDKLVDLKLLQRVSIEHLCEAIACNPDEKSCMYEMCNQCADRELELYCDHEYDETCSTCTNTLPKLRSFRGDDVVECYCWKTKIEILSDGKKSSTVVKELETTYMRTFVEKFHALLSKARRHVFNIRHQYKQYRNLRSVLDNTSCMLHIDFAENYLCQYHREIQSVHFGGSHQQTTMHTGVLYVGQEDPKSFCTISNSRLHEPVAIWAYLQPVFEHLRSSYPSVQTVHVFSDGPTTQYRQKKNFFLFSTRLFELGFTAGSWNFFEASHGKGAADGVGAVLKRTADRLVRQGIDLPTPQQVFNQLRSTISVELYFVGSEQVDAAVQQFDLCNANLPTVPSTMTLHQLFASSNNPGHLVYRDVSCFCNGISSCCQCFAVKEFQFPLPAVDTVNSTGGMTEHSDVADVVAQNTNDASQSCTQPLDSGNDTQLIGKFCVVKYNGKPYPGKILAADETLVTVSCMHCIGTKYDSNRFFWPDRLPDICMYAYDDILSFIPEPERLSNHGRTYNHFRVNPALWDQIQVALL